MMASESNWKDKVRAFLPWKVYWILKRFREEILARTSEGDLTALAKVYKTDKWGHHYYTPVYEQWFRPLRHKTIALLEIGVGGYDKPRHGGDSLRMWKRYFYKGKIIGLDLYGKTSLEEYRIKLYKGDQKDVQLLHQIYDEAGAIDIVIDDGSHVQSHIITSFEALFPLMPSGAIYVIEDTQTSYWQKFEGSTSSLDTAPTAMNYFIQRVHAVNRSEWIKEETPPEIPDQGIASVSFYHNLIIVVKA